MYRQFNIQQFYLLPTQCIGVFCVDLRKKQPLSDRFWGASAKVPEAATSCAIFVCSFVHPHWKIRLLLDGFSLNLNFENIFFENTSRKLDFYYNLAIIKGTLYQDQYIYIYIYIYNILLSSPYNEKCFGRICKENQNTYFTLNTFFF